MAPIPTQDTHLKVFPGDRDLDGFVDTDFWDLDLMSSKGQGGEVRPGLGRRSTSNRTKQNLRTATRRPSRASAIPTELPSPDLLVQQYAAAAKHRRDQLSRMTPMIDGFDLCGAVLGATGEAFHGAFYDWSLRDDGSLGITCGCSEARGLVAAFTATSLLASFRSHVGYPHTSSEMLSRLNQALWTGSTGDQFARLWYGNICPQSGNVHYSASGPTQMLVVRGGELRWIVERESTALGIDPEAYYPPHHLQLAPGEDLIVWTTQAGTLSCDQMNVIDRAVQRCDGFSSAALMDEITDALSTSSCAVATEGSSVVVVRRRLP